MQSRQSRTDSEAAECAVFGGDNTVARMPSRAARIRRWFNPAAMAQLRNVGKDYLRDWATSPATGATTDCIACRRTYPAAHAAFL
jgi:hypothetical protein